MLMGDLLSLRQLQAPVKIVVFRNDALAFVELEMKAAGILDFATDLQNPDFARIAEAAGLRGLTAETPEQVRPMITQAFQHDGPALVDVHVSRQELSMPPTISLERLQPVHAQGCAQRPRRRNHRSGEGQSLSLATRKVSVRAVARRVR
jgi:pyruvate dehydrogenase (quinone)